MSGAPGFLPSWSALRRFRRDPLGFLAASAARGPVVEFRLGPRWWPQPEVFDPQRWLGEAPARPRFASFPFGGGNRVCIGESFAWSEAIVVLAAMAQRWRFVLDPAHPIEPQPLITLRTRHGVRATPQAVRARVATSA